MEVDRLIEWEVFSDYMISDYLGRTTDKYGVGSVDLMSFTGERECIFNILKYAIRLWNNKGKGREYEKISHYAQIAWTKNENEQDIATGQVWKFTERED